MLCRVRDCTCESESLIGFCDIHFDSYRAYFNKLEQTVNRKIELLYGIEVIQ